MREDHVPAVNQRTSAIMNSAIMNIDTAAGFRVALPLDAGVMAA